jgi:hypothetical protein
MHLEKKKLVNKIIKVKNSNLELEVATIEKKLKCARNNSRGFGDHGKQMQIIMFNTC